MENEIVIGATWAHKHDNYTVSIADLAFDKIRTKDADDAAWQRAVGFVREDDAETLYVRAEKDFRNRFVHLSDGNSQPAQQVGFKDTDDDLTPDEAEPPKE